MKPARWACDKGMDLVPGYSAGSIFDISKYRDTCESSIPIFSGIAILRYFWYRTPTVRYLRYLRYLRYFDT